MTGSFVIKNGMISEFDRDLYKKDVNYKGIAKSASCITVAVLIGLATMLNTDVHGVQQHPAIVKEYFGDAVSSDISEYAKERVSDFFADIDVSAFTSVIRRDSTFTYDNADTEARAIELLAEDTMLISIDKVTSIEDEYRVYVTVSVVDANDLLNANRAYLSQAFCSDRNELTENGINKVLLDIIEKDAEPTKMVETYLTVKDSSVDASQLVSMLKEVYDDMRKTDL